MAIDADTEREYSPSSCIGGDYQPFIEAYAERSHLARRESLALGACWEQLQYGSEASQHVLLCLPQQRSGNMRTQGCGLLVFIHGGYWQELSAQQSLFAAAHCVRQGLAFCAINYTLAPAASVGAIVAECRRALEWLAARATGWQIDPARIVVAGSSAGAHLAAMACLPTWRLATGSADSAGLAGAAFVPRAALLLSGIYELAPLLQTSINQALGMDLAQARAQSPLLQSLHGFPRSVVSWGEIETQAFKRQSQSFAAALGRASSACLTQEIPSRNHFDLALDIADPATPLGRLTMALLD